MPGHSLHRKINQRQLPYIVSPKSTDREELDKINAFGYHLTDLYPKEYRADVFVYTAIRPLCDLWYAFIYLITLMGLYLCIMS